MPILTLAPALLRHVSDVAFAARAARGLDLPGADLGAALNSLFQQQPALRGYVLDDAGALRRHVAIFVDGESIADQRRLDVRLSARSEVHIMQALSGG